jgi:hypothetical protein
MSLIVTTRFNQQIHLYCFEHLDEDFKQGKFNKELYSQKYANCFKNLTTLIKDNILYYNYMLKNQN